ncbi:RNA polymerase sigma factor [Actinopolymorpha singaporensis]|uniref:RNA polymerase sigma-70 factor, ECF subfamily n=1 Tax=Actinopolymorpha singaporensis TaxID=117157 RepID=A0A1H1S6U9_9ACTN|nr:sigma-70 family RNA polymerase sigma factor [Actinopolymorpha singaporensis]SDS43528.1 RNA polymerase sigma-70 factor, ECF subfamily [Actinopolymorpha singaporensis]
MSSFADPVPLPELVARARSGDRDALEELLGVIRPLLLRRCSRFLPYLDDAEEAAQDALVAIARNIGDFTGSGSFEGWITVIASNSARMTYRRLRRRAAENGVAELPETADPRTTSVMAGTRLDVMEALSELERSKPQVVEPFVLRDLGSLPYEEIAAITGTSLATVRDRIHVARKFMRSALTTRL